MSLKCRHKVEVLNLRDGDIVNHRILLIRGRAGKRCERLPNQTLLFEINGEQQPTVDGAGLQVSQEFAKGEFKILIDLGEENDEQQEEQRLNLSFTYCTARAQLQISYKPLQSSYRVQPLYIVFQGDCGQFRSRANGYGSAELACRLIDLNLLLVQSLYADRLQEAGFGRRTFKLNANCRIFRSQLTCSAVWERKEDQLWQEIGTEILNSSLGTDEQLKFVAFISCTRYEGTALAKSLDYSYGNIRQHLKGHAALGGGGLALFGSAYFYAWAYDFSEVLRCIKDERKVDLRYYPDDSNYRYTHGGVYATSLGALCHELGHTFDLGHTSDGIMGSGVDYLNQCFTINSVTLDLPQRLLPTDQQQQQQIGAANMRITKLKQQGRFLDKYHEQRQGGDSFYFARNCALTLAHHKWFKCREAVIAASSALLSYDKATQTVTCVADDALKLVELRANEHSMLERYFEVPTKSPDAKQLQRFVWPFSLQRWANSHHLFVITAAGSVKRFDLVAAMPTDE